MIVRIMSKFELKRLAKAINARILTRLGAPTAEEMGYCSKIEVEEVGSQKIIKFATKNDDCRYATIVLRGNTKNTLDDIERAIDDAVNVFECMTKCGKFCPGAGCTEIKAALQLEKEADHIKGLDRYAYVKFANAFETIPRILSDNAGLEATDIITRLYAKNNGDDQYGIDIDDGEIKKIEEIGIYDHQASKIWAVKLATDAVLTILRIDQIIIAKPAGGPKPRENKNWDDDD